MPSLECSCFLLQVAYFWSSRSHLFFAAVCGGVGGVLYSKNNNVMGTVHSVSSIHLLCCLSSFSFFRTQEGAVNPRVPSYSSLGGSAECMCNSVLL